MRKRTSCTLVWKGSTRLKSRKSGDRKVREHEEHWQQERKRLEHSTSSVQKLVDLIASGSPLLKSCGRSGAGKEEFLFNYHFVKKMTVHFRAYT